MKQVYWGLGAVILLLMGLLTGVQISQEEQIQLKPHPWEAQFVAQFDTLGYLQAYESIVPCQPRDVELSEEDNCPVCSRMWEMDQKWFIHHILPRTNYGNYYHAHRLYAQGNSALGVARALKLREKK